MDYISLKYLRDFLGYASEEILFEDHTKVLADIEVKFKEGKNYVQEGISFSPNQLSIYVTTLQDKRQIVFDQWVLASKSLKSLLFHHKLLKNDIGGKLSEHFLFREFTSFISPYAFPKILRVYEENCSKNELAAASHIPVLNADSKWMLQDKISKNILLKWELLKDENASSLSLEDFNVQVKNLFGEEQIEVLNFFTKEFYVQKVSFSEKAIHLFSHPHASYSFALWLSKQLVKLELNPEHENKVQDVAESLKKGDGKYFKVSHKIQSWTREKVTVLVLVPMLLIVGIWVLTKQFSSETGQISTNDDSSFTQFSVKERMQLDSLIKSMDHTENAEQNPIDQNRSYLHLSPVEIDLLQRKAFQNTKAETYIQDCLKANELSEKNAIDSCRIYGEKQIRSLKDDFLKIEQSKGAQKFLLKNESHYQVQVLLFDNKTSSNVYSAYLQTNETLHFKVNIGQVLIFIPGNNLGKALISPDSGISSTYKNHFCFMDGNFIPNLLHDYTIADVSEDEIKILLNDDEQSGFYVLDIYQGLID